MTTTENTATFSEAQVAVVLQMAEEDFEELVTAQLRTDTRDEAAWALLTSSEVITRTKNALDRIRMRVQGTLADKKIALDEFRNECHTLGETGKKTWYQGRVEMTRSQRGTSRFLAFVESAQKEVRALIKQVNTDRYHLSLTDQHRRKDQKTQASYALRKLVAALIKHEAAQSSDGTDEDEELWDLLDEVGILVGDDNITLREAHEACWVN